MRTFFLRFGAAYRSDKTGIIYNNEMDDFGIPGSANIYGFPPTPANLVRPGKRPLSSSVPAIVVHKNGDVKMVLGSSGGTRIITAVTFVSIINLLKTLVSPRPQLIYCSVSDKIPGGSFLY